MNLFGWNVSVYRNYCLRPFFFFCGQYYCGAVKVVHAGPLAVRFSRRPSDLARVTGGAE